MSDVPDEMELVINAGSWGTTRIRILDELRRLRHLETLAVAFRNAEAAARDATRIALTANASWRLARAAEAAQRRDEAKAALFQAIDEEAT